MTLKTICLNWLGVAGILAATACSKETHIHEAPDMAISEREVTPSAAHMNDISAIVKGHLAQSLQTVAASSVSDRRVKVWADAHSQTVLDADFAASDCAIENDAELAAAVACLAASTADAKQSSQQYQAAIEASQSQLAAKLSDLQGLLSIYFLKKFSYQKPLIAQDFFKDRTFIMTSAINQMSSSSPVLSRVFNLSSLRVRIETGAENLRIISLPRGSSGTEQLVGKFPITANYKSGDQIFHEVDFSRPNQSVLFPVFTSLLEDSAAEFYMESFLPRFVKENGDVSDLNFSKADSSMVIEAITLMNLDSSLVETSPSDLSNKYNVLKPTIKMSIGFMVESSADPMPAKSLADITDTLGFSGLADLKTEGVEGAAPFFLADPYKVDKDGRAETGELNVRKINLDQGLHFVLRGNVAQPVREAIHNSVEIWNRHIKLVNPSLEGRDVVTLKIDDDKPFMSPGDPRTSTITWDENPSLPVAWATTAGHPRTGEIFSGDVFIGGKSWALTGCIIYFERAWKKVSETSEFSPPGEMFNMWRGVCSLTLEKLGIYPEQEIELPFAIEDLNTALAEGDTAKVRAFASHFSGAVTAKLSEQTYLAELDHLRGQSQSFNQEADKLAPVEHVGCYRSAASVFELSETGGPLVSPEIDSPEKAALAGLTSVLAHEIGHIIGLRHNFIASTNQGDLDFPFPTLERTKSIMDYNDFGIELEVGLAGAPLGEWDILAINALYGDGSLEIETNEALPFCTDQNVGTVTDCYRHDFGSSRLQYAFYSVNRALAGLKQSGLGTGLGSMEVFSEDIGYLWYELALAGNELKKSTLSRNKAAAHDRLQMILNGKLPDAENGIVLDSYITSFEQDFGFAPMGLLQILAIQPEFFQQEFSAFRRWDYLVTQMATVETAQGALLAAKNTINIQSGRSSDSPYLPLFTTVGFAGEKIFLDELLLDILLQKVIIPAGTELTFDKFGFGEGSKAVVTDEAFLNHQKNVALQRDETEEGVTMYRYSGAFRINDMQIFLNTAALIAGGHRGSPSYKALVADAELLSCTVAEAEICTEMPTITLGEAAGDVVYPIIDLYTKAIETAGQPI